MINRMAVEAMPAGPFRDFFKKHEEYVTVHSVDPDIYKKSHHAEEGPKHFLNMCSNGMKAEDYPRTWKAAVEKFGLHTATKQGTLPWTIQETFDELVAAFKAKDGKKIVEKATWLGHYVGDAHVPFHACANHDGQETGQKGIHSIWESGMLDHNEEEIRSEAEKLVAGMPVAEIKGDVTAWAFERLIAGDHYAHEILAKDKGNRASGREKALLKATGSIAERRIAEGASGLASLWLTAWIKAGKPALPDNVALDGSAPAPGGVDDEGGREEKPSDKPQDKPMDQPNGGDPKPADTPKPADPKPADSGKPSPNAVKGPIPGLMVRDDDDQPGAIVDSVEAGSPGATAGLTRGDVVTAVDGAPVNSTGTFASRMRDYKSGDQVGITILRAGAESYVKVKIP
jgi:hypothetical protein